MRIVTYNIGCSLLSPAIFTWATATGADVLLLQEVEQETSQSEGLEQVANAYDYHAVYVPARTINSSRTHGLAVLSKFPICRVQILELPQFNLRFHSRKRIALAFELRLPDGAVHVYNVHLDSRLNITERLTQLSAVLSHVDVSATGRIVIGGDFNTIPFAMWKNVLPIKFVNQQKILHENMLRQNFISCSTPAPRTFRPKSLRWPLDAIYMRGFEVFGHAVANEIHISDHVPLWVDAA